VIHEQHETKARFDTIRETIDGAIACLLDELALPAPLDTAIRYAALSGGKRLRPLLAIESARAVGGSGDEALGSAVAVELVHAFSLVHDDLPALDNDDLRRGRPTLHKHTDEATAILAGDAMLALAFEAIDRVDPVPNDAAHRALLNELTHGTRAMIVGQIHDTLGGFPESFSDQQRVDLIHENKTGALIRASCVMGAISACADPDDLTLISDLGSVIGLQFQIVDDLLDIEGDPELVGKTLGKDEAANKLTYPSVLGIEGARSALEDLNTRADSILDRFGERAIGLRAIVDALKSRRA